MRVGWLVGGGVCSGNRREGEGQGRRDMRVGIAGVVCVCERVREREKQCVRVGDVRCGTGARYSQ